MNEPNESPLKFYIEALSKKKSKKSENSPNYQKNYENFSLDFL